MLTAHRRADPAGPFEDATDERPGACVALGVDQIVAAGESAEQAVRMLEGLPGEGGVFERVLLGVERWEARPGSPAHASERTLEAFAASRRFVFSRAGNGRMPHVHLDLHAAPGRLVVGDERSLTSCGVVGALACAVSEVELAAVLASGLHRGTWPEVTRVRLVGRAPSWIGGVDVALALKRRLAPASATWRVIECTGAPLGLSLWERVAMARELSSRGTSVLFPPDDAVRDHLKAVRREADWRTFALEPDEDGEAIDLATLEPMLGREEGAFLLREGVGARVDVVTIGPEATLEELERLAARMRGRRVAEGTTLQFACGSRSIAHGLATSGALATLAASGARRVHADEDDGWAWRAPEERALCCGARRLPGLHAGIEACALAALTGEVADPRTPAPGPATPASGEIEITTATAVATQDGRDIDRWVGIPSSNGVTEPHEERVFRPKPLRAAPRGSVLAALGDHVSMDDLLPWGARVRAHRGDVLALARHACGTVAHDLHARARRQGGGFLVTGFGTGAGPERPEVAEVLAALAISAVIARSFAPGFRRELALQGVLPLTFAHDADALGLERGDELELPDLPDGLEPHRPVVLRNLTRGTQLTLRHDLGAREIAMMRAGGLLALVAAHVPGAERSVTSAVGV